MLTTSLPRFAAFSVLMLAAQSARAVLILHEDFNYTGGTAIADKNGGSGWTTDWGTVANQPAGLITGSGLSYVTTSGANTYTFSSSGNAAAWASQEGTGTRSYNGMSNNQNVAGTTLYFSFLFNPATGATTGDYRVLFYNTQGSAASSRGVGVEINGNGTISTRMTGTVGTASTATFNRNATNLVVGQFIFNGGTGSTPSTLNLWLNPTNLSNLGTASISGTKSITNTDAGMVWNSSTSSVYLRTANVTPANSLMTYDELRLGTTLADVLPYSVSAVPEPSAFAAMAGFGALGCAALRRRRRG